MPQISNVSNVSTSLSISLLRLLAPTVAFVNAVHLTEGTAKLVSGEELVSLVLAFSTFKEMLG
jgi:hypothetical protein